MKEQTLKKWIMQQLFLFKKEQTLKRWIMQQLFLFKGTKTIDQEKYAEKLAIKIINKVTNHSYQQQSIFDKILDNHELRMRKLEKVLK